jgi:hypothetical protein
VPAQHSTHLGVPGAIVDDHGRAAGGVHHGAQTRRRGAPRRPTAARPRPGTRSSWVVPTRPPHAPGCCVRPLPLRDAAAGSVNATSAASRLMRAVPFSGARRRHGVGGAAAEDPGRAP